jgi:hypothetical protein
VAWLSPGATDIDLTWQSDMPQSLQMCCDLAKDLLQWEFKQTMRHCLKTKNEVDEFFKSGSNISIRWQEIGEQRLKEVPAVVDRSSDCKEQCSQPQHQL